GAGLEHRDGIARRADAAADGERDRHAFGDARGDVDRGAAAFDRRRHVEEDELVRSGLGVRAAELDRVADVPQAAEAHALHHPPGGDVEARDQTRERHRSRKRAPAAPLFSGWNCTPRKEPCSTIAATPSLVAVAAAVSAAYECANQYAAPSGSTGAQPMRGTRCSRNRTARPGTSPSPQTPPSSSLSSSASCRPRQIPRICLPRSKRSCSAASSPRARRPAIAVAAEPTPGTTARSAPATSSVSCTPSRVSASSTERTLPAPYAHTAAFTAG